MTGLIRIVGVLFVIAAMVAAYFWFYKIAPIRHLADRSWLQSHSEQSRWIEEQRDYERMNSSPDLEFRGDRIGYYGDKHWFLWLEKNVATDKRFRVCGCTETALALMANLYTNSWDDWLKSNQNKTQEEWIRDGFARYGVLVHLPPNEKDVEPLLNLIGRKRWVFLMGGPQGTNAPEAIPDFVQYNAFRWLRDSGFNAGKFAYSNTTEVSSQNLTLALIRYMQYEAAFPAKNELGILEFGKHQEIDPMLSQPWIAGTRIKFGICFALLSIFAAGLWMICFVRRK